MATARRAEEKSDEALRRIESFRLPDAAGEGYARLMAIVDKAVERGVNGTLAKLVARVETLERDMTDAKSKVAKVDGGTSEIDKRLALIEAAQSFQSRLGWGIFVVASGTLVTSFMKLVMK